MASILLINPNTSAPTTGMMLRVARPLLPDGWTIRGCQAVRGAAMILDEAALAVSEAEVVRIGTAAAGTADAVVVSAFGNPGAGALRALLPVPVVGIGEAALLEAAAGDRRFGIATTTPQLAGAIRAGVHGLGLGGSFTGLRLTAEQPLALAARPADQEEALAAAVAACIEQDGAQAVVIGGGPLSEAAARLRLRFPAAIIEPVPAAMRRVVQALAGPGLSARVPPSR